jgi:hypothetical protein
MSIWAQHVTESKDVKDENNTRPMSLGLLNKYTKDIYGSIVYIWNRNSSSDDKRENCFDLGQCNVRAKKESIGCTSKPSRTIKGSKRKNLVSPSCVVNHVFFKSHTTGI